MRRHRWAITASAGLAITTLVAAGCAGSAHRAGAPPTTVGPGATSPGATSPGASGSLARPGPVNADLGKIKHIIVIMQENRSFDSYFGTYPGAAGLPMTNGQPTSCVPDPRTPGQCVKPYVDHADVNGGGPHGQTNATADINGGQMDGFVAQAERASKGCTDPNNPACANSRVGDVMGYHTQSDIPNYWSYAKNFVLQDHMFEPNASWSLPSHLFMVSG
ncbi:MAG: phospholipase, partial [Actinomycetota bacterium]|nr:phospholipase [Actinomycetota bacterium]